MWLASWFDNWTAQTSRPRQRPSQQRVARATLRLERLEDRVVPSAGDLDPSFGVGGKVTTDLGGLIDDFGRDIAIQADGKIVVVGTSCDIADCDFALARYDSDGSLDTSFGVGGKVSTDFFGLGDFARGLAIQTDGKIVVAGFANVGTRADFALARYNSDGSLDTSFGTGGKVTTDFTGSSATVESLTLQPDGKIVVAGSSLRTLSDFDFALARYNSDGSPDATFDTDGKVTTDFGGSDGAFGVAIQADGKIVAAGVFFLPGVGTDFALARYNSDGSLDTNSDADPLTHFDGDGKVTTDFAGSSDFASRIALQADGRIIVAGLSATPSVDFALARYTSDGSLDATFDGDGKVTTDFGLFDEATGLAIQADGKIVVAGSSGPSGSGFDFALARYIAVAQNVIIEQIIPDVQALVASGVLKEGQGRSLLVKLQAALQLLDSGQQVAAKQLLGAFVAEVEGYITAGILTPSQGQPLIDQANDAMALIDGSSLQGDGGPTPALADAVAIAWLDDWFAAFWESWLTGQFWDELALALLR